MAELVADTLIDTTIEIIPPEDTKEQPDSRACLCCKRRRQWMDDDGCGICEECLAS
ncbi:MULTISPECIES: hypothetical protein [Rhizobium]|uniref:Uncharacterized protein n=1 Tax=Rhizobium indicum TaxID=2583231 RepID=A0ABX6PMC9_9HYPH|nr:MULTISPECIES: hypothetical protein [Rhizobium]MBA1346914.1 hypothetical protein [Rhizobium sp. WYCCWR 11146]NNU64088.1 hypothetical protein [Rhizobium sp. WYCCWR 11152]NYT32550.1 hypothetical protein [Rhizobium sp. WYCCWR 11128]QKK19806.1 hypothetical protein FFM53_025500 [Rhizobium indicum]QKK33651.1 hypothetical protein FE844_029520 [Rhizobium indicum]